MVLLLWLLSGATLSSFFVLPGKLFYKLPKRLPAQKGKEPCTLLSSPDGLPTPPLPCLNGIIPQPYPAAPILRPVPPTIPGGQQILKMREFCVTLLPQTGINKNKQDLLTKEKTRLPAKPSSGFLCCTENQTARVTLPERRQRVQA